MTKHWLFVFSSLLLAATWEMVVSSAQERQMGGEGITVFTNSNFRGKSATFRQDVSDLSRFDLNDKISSLKVAPGDDPLVPLGTRKTGLNSEKVASAMT